MKIMAIAVGSVVVVSGFLLGINVGKGNDLLSNPFAGAGLTEKIISSSERVFEESMAKGGDVLVRSGEALKERMSE